MAFDLGKEVSTQLKTRVFKKVVGGLGDTIRGIPGIGNSSELGKLATRQKSTVDHYSFPLDVESGTETGNHGHYIMFYINEQEHAKIKFGELDSSGRGSVLEEAGRRKILPRYKKITSRPGSANSPGFRIPLLDSGGFGGEAARYDTENQNVIDTLIQGFGKEESDFNKLINKGFREQMTMKNPFDSGAGYKKYKPINEETYNGINVKRAPTKRLKTAISMYMPPDITTSYGVGYSDATIGLFTEQAQSILTAFGSSSNNSSVSLDAALRQGFTQIADEVFGGGVEAMLTQMLLATADQIPGLGGSKAVFGMREGKVFSPRMEVAFQGLEKRKFSYTFKMTPRSSREAEEIRAIIYAFKHNMLPEIDNDFTAGRRMIVPNTFDISYMYNGSENEFLHKISTCVLENLEVKYGGATGKYETFTGGDNGAPVVETTITLAFKEMETITRERAQEGF